MEASLVYKVSSRTARATQRNPVSKNKSKTKPNQPKPKKLKPKPPNKQTNKQTNKKPGNASTQKTEAVGSL